MCSVEYLDNNIRQSIAYGISGLYTWPVTYTNTVKRGLYFNKYFKEKLYSMPSTL